MSVREARRQAEQCSREVTRRIAKVVHDLSAAATSKDKGPCIVCGARSERTRFSFAIPVSFIATCLVLNDLDDHFAKLPLRTAWLCTEHGTYFQSLFVDAGDRTLDIDRLERRARALQAVEYGQLVVFGGLKAIEVLADFQADLERLKEDIDQSA